MTSNMATDAGAVAPSFLTEGPEHVERLERMILSPNTSVQLVDQQGRATSFFTKFLSSVVNALGASRNMPWSPGAIGPGAVATTNVSVPDVTVGQPAAAAFTQNLSGVVPLAFVSAPGNVNVVLWNTNGATVTPAAGTVTALVWTP